MQVAWRRDGKCDAEIRGSANQRAGSAEGVEGTLDRRARIFDRYSYNIALQFR
jgi:hypothetical protein